MQDALYTEIGLNLAVQSASDEGRELDDSEARAVASAWHGGQSSAFYSFASSGHFDADELSRELSRTIAQSYATANAADRLALDMMGTYIIARSIADRPAFLSIPDRPTG